MFSFFQQLTNNWSGQCPLQYGLLIVEYVYHTTIILDYFVILLMGMIYSDLRKHIFWIVHAEFSARKFFLKVAIFWIFSKSFNLIASEHSAWDQTQRNQGSMFLKHFFVYFKVSYLMLLTNINSRIYVNEEHKGRTL